MTTSANPLLENCCNPCTSCPDDGPIIDVEILDPSDCNTNCCWNSCSDNKWINIQSTNDCLIVDTSECGVVKLTAECPRPTYVKAWQNVTVRDVTPPDDCYIDWWDCWVKWWWEINATDEKVKACSWDTTPGYLNQKLEGSRWINVEEVGCDWNTNSKLRLTFNDELLPKCEYPEVVVHNDSKLIQTSYWWPEWHDIRISDKETTSYDNMVCLWFEHNKYVHDTFDNQGNTYSVQRVDWWDNGRTVYTWNRAMATHQGIKILESWYYRIFGQLTVENNANENWTVPANQYYINLWRAFLKIKRQWIDDPILLSTAKHWAYWRQVLLTWWTGISVSEDGVISFTWGSFSWSWRAPEGWWTVSVSGPISVNAWWGTQTNEWFDWPWATFNVEIFVDLRKNDVISLWYRPQSDMTTSAQQTAYFIFTWQDDESTEFERIFWWSMLWACLLAPKLFNSDWYKQIYNYI